jgi:hypothetical protein
VTVADWTQITAALAGAGSAVAGAIAAGAAWRSASQSNAAARDVREALGLAIKPTIDVSPYHETRIVGGADPEQVYGVGLSNASLWDAVDVEIETVFHDGRTYSKRLPRIEATDVKGKARTERIDLDNSPQPGLTGVGVTEVGQRSIENAIYVRYWDERHLLHWELTYKEIIIIQFDGRIQGHSSGAPRRSERLLSAHR